ncbi:PTS sugar transporter [Streptomyces cinereoruber]|uniref:PTS sugar transporter n=1 Tax=Streptomyces cinereoruber TaxID=67260 RepID=UPI003C2DD39F
MPDPEENAPDIDGIIKGLGGPENVQDSSTHNHDLLVVVRDVSLVDEGALKAAGAAKVSRHSETSSFKIAIGPDVDAVVWAIES